MRSRVTSLTLAILCSLTATTVLHAQQPAPTTRDVRLPDPDPQIQKWLTTLGEPPGPNRGGNRAEEFKQWLAPIAEAVAAREQRTLTEEAWYTQVLVYLSSKRGEDAWVKTIQLMMYSRMISGLQYTGAIKVIIPYMDSPDPWVARIAHEMIAYSTAFSGQPVHVAMESYLRGTRPGDPSWKMVLFLYGGDPDGVLDTIASVYLDRPTQQQLERTRKELTILIYSADLAAVDQKAEWSNKIVAKLEELAAHPHWVARTYALAKIMRTPTLVINPAARVIPARLTQDPNPAVAELAGALQRMPTPRPR